MGKKQHNTKIIHCTLIVLSYEPKKRKLLQAQFENISIKFRNYVAPYYVIARILSKIN